MGPALVRYPGRDCWGDCCRKQAITTRRPQDRRHAAGPVRALCFVTVRLKAASKQCRRRHQYYRYFQTVSHLASHTAHDFGQRPLQRGIMAAQAWLRSGALTMLVKFVRGRKAELARIGPAYLLSIKVRGVYIKTYARGRCC
jgi:hypothetical protein